MGGVVEVNLAAEHRDDGRPPADSEGMDGQSVQSICEKGPFFSVIIPVHDKVATVGRAIRSVLAQRFTDFEVLIIDDASSDGSRTEMECFGDDPRVRILHRDVPGPGGYAARNVGIQEARGSWLAFLDADDEWTGEHLTELGRLASAPGAQFLATAWVTTPRDAFDPEDHRGSTESLGSSTDLDFSGFLRQRLIGKSTVWTGAAGVRRSLMQAIGGFPLSCRRGGDVVVWLRLIDQAGVLRQSPRRTAVYHTEDSTVTRTVVPELVDNCIYRACRELMDKRTEPSERSLLMQFSNIHIRHALHHRARAGQLRFSDCHWHYAAVALRKHLLLRSLALLPGAMQRTLWRWYTG